MEGSGTESESESDASSSSSSSSGDSDSNESEDSQEEYEDSGDESAEDSDSDDDNLHEMDGDAPVYENARITMMESVMMILSLSMTFNLSGECLVQVMELIELHCPAVNRCVKTLHNFKKIFRRIGRNLLVLHYYCEQCFKSLPGKDIVCRNCGDNTKQSFFIEVPILNQLQRLFMRSGFLQLLSYRFVRQKKHANNFEDIFDGRLYRDQMGNGGFLNNRNNVSFMWYTDGISIFKSTKFSVWPLFLVINELNYKERTKKENIILAGLWFGKSKPRPNLFMKPFKQFFETFKTVGYEMNVPNGPPIVVKGLVLCGTCDLQAKGLFLRSKLSNGYFGCNKCQSGGQRVPAGRTTVHVHPYINPDNMQLRDNNQVPAHARTKSFGFKGLSALHPIMPNMIRGTAIDIMHMIFLGITKLLMKLWFDPKFAGEEFSCVGMIDVVNHRLSKIAPPSFVQRLTRTLADLKLWKAKEYKLWFFYYSSVVMFGILPNVYLEHHMKLVSALSLLSLASVSPEQVDAADALLNQYLSDFEPLYSLRFMGMNVHLLSHLPEMVRDLGPLWVYSCFFMEDLNGQLVKLIHSPYQPGLQICSSASLFLSLKSLIDKLPAQSHAKIYCNKLYTVGGNYKIVEQISEKMAVIGKSGFKLNVTQAAQQALRNYLGIADGHFQAFFTLRKSGVLYTSESKIQITKRCCMYASFLINNVPVLGKIKEFVRYSNCLCGVRICLCQPAQHFCLVQVYNRVEWHAHDYANVRISYLSAVRPTANVAVFSCDELVSMCFYIKIGNHEYLATQVNSLEYE